MARIVNRFSWHSDFGNFAEKDFRRNYFVPIGLQCRKIKIDNKNKKPDIYIKDSKYQNIAIAEIKAIKYKEYGDGCSYINIIETINYAIVRAKKQLASFKSELPKIIYLIGDNSFVKPKTLIPSIFGKWKTKINRNGQIIFNNYSGLDLCDSKDNIMADNLISAIICYIPLLDKSYDIWSIFNKDSVKIPNKLIDKKHIKKCWEYNKNIIQEITINS